MPRKSQLETELEKYSTIVESNYLTPKFEFTGNDLILSTPAEKVQSTVRAMYNSLASKIINKLPNYNPSYATRYKAINRITIKTTDKVLSQLASRSKEGKGARGNNPKVQVQDLEF